MNKYLLFLFAIGYMLNTYANSPAVPQYEAVYKGTNYAYVVVGGKFLSKKLKVKVDLGDTDEQVESGKALSEVLTNKKSYAAILNYMADLGYELVSTLDLTNSYNGSGGTSGIVYVLKKKE